MLVSDLPTTTSALSGLTVRKGSRPTIIALRVRLQVQREMIDQRLDDLDELAAKAVGAAQQARNDVALIDGQLAALDAALATPEAVA